MRDFIEYLIYIKGISPFILLFLGLIIYFIPWIIRSFYGWESIKFYIINLFLWRTPLPYIILILDIMKQYKKEILNAIKGKEDNLDFKISNNSNWDKKNS